MYYIICFSLNLLFKFTSALPEIMVMISFIMNRDVLNASIVTGFDKNLHQAFNTWSLNIADSVKPFPYPSWSRRVGHKKVWLVLTILSAEQSIWALSSKRKLSCDIIELKPKSVLALIIKLAAPK